MSGFETAQAMIEELGPLLGAEAVAAFPEERTWSVMLPSGARFDVALDDDDEIMVFALDIGAVPKPAAARVHDMLLRLSFLWRESGGVAAALDDTGAAALLLRRRLAALDPTAIARLMKQLADYADRWAEILEEAETWPDEQDPPAPPPFVGVRV